MRSAACVSLAHETSPFAMASRSVAAAPRSAPTMAAAAEPRFQRADRRSLAQLLDRGNDAEVG